MNPVTIMAFQDELTKIADNAAVLSSSVTTGGSISSAKNQSAGGDKQMKIPSADWAPTHSMNPPARYGTADGIKATPPPPVRT